MAIDAARQKTLIEEELARLSDSRVIEHIRSLLVEPSVAMLLWDYGQEGERHPCWTVLRHPNSDTAIAYCEDGFGPRSPWGLIYTGDDVEDPSMGMDSAWFTTFLQAVFESFAVTELPIWRVFKTDSSTGATHAITDEGEWDATWTKVKALRDSDPENRYHCDTSIQYERE